MVIAHQYIEQMSEEVRAAVFGNVGSMIAFRVGAYDAEILEKEFAPTFTQEDMVNLGFVQIYLKLMIDGVSSQPFSATTLPPIPKPLVSFKEDIIRWSRETYAKPRLDVEEAIKKWHEPLMPAFSSRRSETSRQSEMPRRSDKDRSFSPASGPAPASASAPASAPASASAAPVPSTAPRSAQSLPNPPVNQPAYQSPKSQISQSQPQAPQSQSQSQITPLQPPTQPQPTASPRVSQSARPSQTPQPYQPSHHPQPSQPPQFIRPPLASRESLANQSSPTSPQSQAKNARREFELRDAISAQYRRNAADEAEAKKSEQARQAENKRKAREAKGPTPQNLNALRDALAAVMKQNPDVVSKVAEPAPVTNLASTSSAALANQESIGVNSKAKKHAQSTEAVSGQTVTKPQESDSLRQAPKEVPEDVLRRALRLGSIADFPWTRSANISRRKYPSKDSGDILKIQVGYFLARYFVSLLTLSSVFMLLVTLVRVITD